MRCRHPETYVDVVRSHNVHTFHVLEGRRLAKKMGCEAAALARSTYLVTCADCGVRHGPATRSARKRPAWVRHAVYATLGVE